ncbi:MAG: hypothetical protein LH660_20965, partial [Phormidesmis sp. CAN_BIN36]|nr:hypothetical protein [Phormidesmis sp. CAN_BIN36]
LDQGYQPIPVNEEGWRWCQTLELWLGSWSGAVDIDTTTWLRFYDRAGNLVPLPEEAERQRADEECRRADEQQQRADEERQRADRLAARLRELGEDPDRG